MARTMTLKLNAPGMTNLHKAGLAGLYMTLRAFEEKKREIEGLDWTLGPKQILLTWKDETPRTAFEELVRQSFWIDDKGFIRLTGLEFDKEPDYDKRYLLYYSLLHSFLQFGPHRPTENKRVLTYEVDDRPFTIRDFAPIKKIPHSGVVQDFIDSDGQFKSWMGVKSWLYPGGGKRHWEFGRTQLGDDTERVIALLFAPVGVVFYAIRSRTKGRKGRKARLAMLVPQIDDLTEHAACRRLIAAQGTIELTASSASDAALRMLIAIEASHTTKQFSVGSNGPFRCRVISFGIVPWVEKQKTRTDVRTVFSGNLPGLENYRTAAAIFKNRWQRVPPRIDRKGNEVEPERFFVTTFSAREMIADNIATGNVWYHNIADYMTKKETREQLFYERKEMHEMVQSAEFDDESKRRFIHACHKSWRSRMGKLGERARRENLGEGGFKRLVDRERERLRIAFARSKNAQTLRETVVDFWARGGTNKELQADGLMKVLPLFSDVNWREARDLALLALISYQPKNEVEEKALAPETNEGEEES